MIKDFLNKVPAGMMVVPMLISAFINTFFPDLFKIGGFTGRIYHSWYSWYHRCTAGLHGRPAPCHRIIRRRVRRGGTLNF